MLKVFLQHSALYSIASLFTRGISFLLLPLYTAVLSPEHFGMLDFITVIGSIVAVTVTLEVTQSLHRYLPEFLGTEDLKLYTSAAAWFSVCCYALLVLSFLLFDENLAEFFFDDKSKAHIVRLMALLYCSNAALYFFQTQLRCELKAKKNVIVSFISSLFSIAFTAAALLWLKAGIEGLILALFFGHLVGALVAFYYTKAAFIAKCSLKHLKTMLVFSAPLIPSSLGVVASLYIDRVMIKEMLSLHELGLYSVASKVAMITSLVLVGIQQALTPLIYNQYKQKETPANIAKIFHLYISCISVMLIILVFFSQEIISLIAPAQYSEAGDLIPFLCFSVVFSSMYIFFPGLYIEKKTREIALVNILGAGLNLVLNFTLISSFGLIGAAWSTLIASLTVLVIYYYFSQKLYPIPIFKTASV